MMSRPTAVVSGAPSIVTMPSLTVTVKWAGSHRYVPRIRSWVISCLMSASGLLNTLSTSARDTMPISVPSSAVTGSRLTRREYIRRAAWLTVSSGRMVTAGLVIRSAAVSAAALACSRWCVMVWNAPGSSPASASLVSRSASETIPMTLLSPSSTGNALTRCSRSLDAISLNVASCLTAITWVLITSFTMAFTAVSSLRRG